MDGFYRGIEVSLLAFSLILGLGVFGLSGRPGPQPAMTQMAVTLPMLSVTATP